ncbi:hypothetical protein BH10BDE1_BH10BDE1_22850 [soil metagenome]
MSAPSLKFLVAGSLALSIALAPLKSSAANAIDATIDQVQKQSDAQLAKLMSEYAATTLVILDMKVAHLYSQALSNIDDPSWRMAANAGTYTVVLGATTMQTWQTLVNLGKVPSLIKATPGLRTKVSAVGGAALRIGVLGGIAYTLWHTNTVLLLDKQDYNEILMRLEANGLALEHQLGALAKAKMNPSVPAAAKDPGAPTNNELFKLE